MTCFVQINKIKRFRIGASLEVRSKKTTAEHIEWLHEIGLNHIEIKRDHDFIYPMAADKVRKLLKNCDICVSKMTRTSQICCSLANKPIIYLRL